MCWHARRSAQETEARTSRRMRAACRRGAACAAGKVQRGVYMKKCKMRCARTEELQEKEEAEKTAMQQVRMIAERWRGAQRKDTCCCVCGVTAQHRGGSSSECALQERCAQAGGMVCGKRRVIARECAQPSQKGRGAL